MLKAPGSIHARNRSKVHSVCYISFKRVPGFKLGDKVGREKEQATPTLPLKALAHNGTSPVRASQDRFEYGI